MTIVLTTGLKGKCNKKTAFCLWCNKGTVVRVWFWVVKTMELLALFL